MSESVFTKIIKGEIPCYKIYENDQVIAFLDINPLRPGHTLVVPKLEVDLLWDLPDDNYLALMSAAKRLAKHIQQILGCTRVGSLVEGFEMNHAHIHLVPLNEGFMRTYDSQPKHPASSESLEQMRKKLAITD